jgi:hypothetical protein
VISDEHTSQTYLMPPSVPRVPVFFLMTPMPPHYRLPVKARRNNSWVDWSECGRGATDPRDPARASERGAGEG